MSKNLHNKYVYQQKKENKDFLEQAFLEGGIMVINKIII